VHTVDILVVRHAAIAYVDTDGQVRDTVAVNPPLTRLGELQAAALANRLSRADITRVYSSPAIRCLQTAQKIVAATGVAGEAVPWLGEAGRMWEDWDRRPERVEETFPGIARGSGPTEEEWGLARAEAGERLFERPAQALRARAARVLATIWAAHPRTSDERICLVTHSGLGGYGLLPEMLASPAADNPRFVLAHASLSAVRCDGRGHLALRVNCTRHLVGLTVVLCADQTCAHQSPNMDDRRCSRCGGPVLTQCPTCATEILAPASQCCTYCGRPFYGRRTTLST
jgi:probable phosphoglycerate mutase